MNAQQRRALFFLFTLFLFVSGDLASGSQPLTGHIPAILSKLQPLAHYSGTNRLNLAISLPLRNQAALSNLLAQIYDPASPNYHHYLTPDHFTEEFGPSRQDYQSVIHFANAHGLRVTRTWSNRSLVDVEGSVGDIESALHTTLNVYRHPAENRTFYAPANEPSLDLATPVLHISGLDNFELPRPHLTASRIAAGQNAVANAGSGPSGTYMGRDFRAAYVPDSSLSGSGQSVGLLEFDGYAASDINYYETAAGVPNVPLQNVLVDGASANPTSPGGADVEVALDIEMAISMATNLSDVVVYIAPDGAPFEDILNKMAANPQVRQFSCSWYVPNGPEEPAADQIFEQMAAQGQSFFAASGDSDAYTGLIPFPGDTPYVTEVGGTTLTTTGPAGSWVSETVWNWGDGVGSSGGISTQYPIPSWQTNISMSANQGSTTMRNTPDVAMTADNVYVRADGSDYNVGGTSCAAPLWAGFAALVNQQAVGGGKATIGLINAAADTIGTSPAYTAEFHDITTGNNTSGSSPRKFYAVAGYDLCTGWGTPSGQKLINALANPEALVITPTTGFISTGGVNGPFTVTSQELSLTNFGTNTLTWSLSNTSSWLTASPVGGALTPGGPATTVTVSLNSAASNLVVGTYSATLWFTNLNDGFGQAVGYVLNVIAPPSITSQPSSQAVLEGSAATFTVAATGGQPLAYQWQFDGTNLTDGAGISGSTGNSLTINDVSLADVGDYSVIVTNLAGVMVSSNAALTITPSQPVIVMQPSNQTSVVGDTVNFDVGVVGTTPYSYQWSFDGTNIQDATNSFLVLTNVQQTQSGLYSVAVANALGSTISSNATLTVFPAPVALFFDDFDGPSLNPIWQTNLPNAYCGSFPQGGAQIAAYVGAPNYSFGLLDSNTVLNLDDNMGPLQRRGWGSSTNFILPYFRYEARFNSLYLSSATSIDGFFEIWIMNATNNNLYDIVSPFAGGFGSNPYMFFGSSVDNSFIQGSYAVTSNTWYRLVLQCLPGQNIRASLCDDNDNELIGHTFAHDGSAFGSGFQIVFSQAVGASGSAYPTKAAVDYVKLTTGFAPVISVQPQSQVAIVGTNVIFTVTANGTSPLGYQWNLNGTNLIGETNSTLSLTDVQPGDTGQYSVVVTNIYGLAASSNAFLEVGTAPVITSQPTNEIVSQGGTAIFNVAAAGSLPLSYQWSFDGNEITGATNAALILADAQFGQSGGYTVLVSNIFGFVLSSNVSLTVLSPPAITMEPTNQSVAVGGTATLSVTAGGTVPLNYQWSFDNVNIPGATSAILVLSNVQLSQSGDYSVVVTNIYGAAQSSNAVLTVYGIPPFIITQPVGQIAPPGGTATFLVSAGGTQPLNYQWNFDGTNIVGATNSMLILSNVQPSQAGDYAVFISNAFGSTNSSSATLTVSSVFAGAFFDDFNGPLNPIWQSNLPNAYCGSSGGEIATYVGTPGYNFGILNSNSVIYMTNDMGPLQRRGWGSSTNFLAANFRYEARFNSLYVSSTTSIDGFIEIWIMNATNANLYDIVSPFAGDFGGSPYMFFGSSIDNHYTTGSYAVANNTWYRLVLQCLPGQNIRASLCDDNERELTGYTFNHNGSAFGSGFKIVLSQAIGASGVPYPDAVAADYVSLTSQFSPIITTQPQSQTVPEGAPVTLGVISQGAFPLNYQWNLNGMSVPGATNSTLTITNVLPDNLGVYNVTVTNAYGSLTSSNAVLATYALAPAITTQPTNETVAIDGTAAFSVTASGTLPLAFQWSFDNVNIPGATNSALVLTNAQLAQSGNYSVVVTNIYGSVQSSNAVLTVYGAPPFIVTQPASQSVLQGGSATFTVSAGGAQPLGYQWNFGGVNIPGATNASLTLSNVQPSQAGNYAVFISNAFGSTNSSSAVLTVNPAFTGLFFDDFTGPSLNPIWQSNLPNAYCGSFPFGSAQIASYAGAPGYYFSLLNSNTVIDVTNRMGPLQRRGWSSSTNFLAANFHYEARFNSLFISSTTSIDGFIEIWIMNATNNNLYDIVSPFAGGFGGNPYMFFGSSIDNNYSQGSYAVTNNTWYRLVLQCLPGQNIRASLCDDNERELIGYTFNHNGSGFGSGFNIVLSQSIGSSGSPYPDAAAVDYVSVASQFSPMIITQPQSLAASEGSNATFRAIAEGAFPLSYQWNFDGTNIAAATNSTLTITNVQQMNLGAYAVVITNSFGSLVSSNAFLSIVGAPAIFVQPTNETVSAANSATFSVTAGGAPPLSYQWNFNGTTLIPGATNSTLTLNNVQFAGQGIYSVIVTNQYGSIVSSNAMLTVTVDHFAWNNILSPRFRNTPFAVQVVAQDAANNVYTNYASVVFISSTNGVPVSPALSSNFVQGVWTGTIVASQTATNLVLSVSDGLGHIGLANPINVVNLPSLTPLSSAGTIYIAWPVDPAGFVLQMTTNITSSYWGPVPGLPLQFGGQYIQPIVAATNSGVFYRLKFNGP
ncbi:MAG TPA: immunoglobulin domain-containing protein [Alphaproteobacteria bacterium]|nr:immunoglobulin domain-containing protein [Alphaproteobacteria bacterium]